MALGVSDEEAKYKLITTPRAIIRAKQQGKYRYKFHENVHILVFYWIQSLSEYFRNSLVSLIIIWR